MIPSNPFGGSRGGQPTSDSQSQPFGCYQAPTFGQFSSQGNAFFGQPTIPATSVSGGSQATAFNQPSSQSVSAVFGQTTAKNTGSVFGSLPSFGVSSSMVPPSFGQQLQHSSQQASNLGASSEAFDSTSSLGPSPPLGFGQTVFGHPSSTSVSTSVFSSSSSGGENKGFTSSNFSFKPAGESLFKPIFGPGPDPQTSLRPDSNFGRSEPQKSSSILNSDSGSTNFFSFPGAKSRPADFNFSQPSSALSVTAQNNPPTTGSNSTNTVQFTFSQPLPLSSSSGLPSTSQPTTPSSFSFSINPPKPEKTTFFKGTGFDQSPLFGDTKICADARGDETGQNLKDTNLFTAFSRGTKRKEGTVVSGTSLEKSTPNEGVPGEADSNAHSKKRPHMRFRGPLGGIFSRAVNDLCREGNNPGGFQAAKGKQQQLPVRETERDDVQAQTNPPPATELKDPPQQSVDQPQPPEESVLTDSRSGLDPDAETKSPGNYSGPPTDSHIIVCKNVPPDLNKKDILEKHFGRFGKVCKVFCRPAKNTATVHFNDHASAAQAKKKGKILRNKELLLLWQRKKQSPGEKWSRPAAGTEETKGESEADSKSKASSPYKRTSFSASPVRSTATLSHRMPMKRSIMAKSLQFNTEPQKENITESQSLECPVPSSFSYLIGQVAETAEEKYRLLEQRDKVLRQGRPKRTDLDMSKVFVGTCPDMCPEKERFMRETRKQLSVFEVIPGTEMVDHSAAVKEYSRSSADQEEPLPQELRPLPVLCMTMDYLVTQIMDQVHENCRDWYDFVWNRTRGIRKDIIQQHLCCPDTVSLIEKCTRFHVHCAHHLCEEHISAFDAKINNENMTKCLQSLKEMYQDMAMQQVYCSREAEFRQYSVLLRLNDGDILREVQQFRAEVRNSPEVKLAVQAFSAVNSNNFVRFFKLVKRASYLVSCLLHRYFNQVRGKALQTLNLAHTVGPRSTAFPLEDIVRMLMFNSPEEAIDFIQNHGLVINDGVVEMSRTNYQQPDLPLSPKKSDIILAKKTALVGEVVNGGPLPTPPQHIPVCSFDSQNKYRGEVPAAAAASTTVQIKVTEPKLEVRIADAPAALGPSAGIANQTAELREPYRSLAQPTDSQQLFLPISQPQPVKPPSPEPVYHTEDLTSVLDCVIEEVLADVVTEVAGAGVSYATTALVESIVQAESVLSEVLGQTLQEISSDEMEKERLRVEEERRKLEEARRKQEHEAFLINFSHSLCTTLVNEVLDETLKNVAISEIKKAVQEKAECVARCTEQICTTIVEETLNADITALVETILEAKLQCIQKYITRWRNVVALRQQLKRQMRVFPAAPCFVDPLRKQKALVPSAPMEPCMEKLAHGVVHLGNAGNLAISSTRLLKLRKEVLKQMRVHFYYQQLLDEAVWLPLNLPQLVVENISKLDDQTFWKAVIFLPSYHDSVSNLSDRILSEWLETKFGGGREPSDGTLRTIHFTNTIQEKEQCLHRVHISIKALRGPLSEHGMSKMESLEFQGTRALIMLLPSTSINETEENDPDVPLLSALLQLKQFQQASTCHCPLPLVILVPGSDTEITQKLEEALVLQELVQEDLISEYRFFFIPESSCDLQGCAQLKQVMSWLVAHAPPSTPLCCQPLQQLVETTLNQQFISRVYIEHQKRTTAQLPSVRPSSVISLYNAVLTHIADNVASTEMEALPPCEFWQPESPEFAPYLGWNFVRNQAWIRKAILSLQLPQWESMCATDSWTELCSSVYGYAAQIPLTGHSQPLLMSRLENLLERVKVKSKIIPGIVCSGCAEIPWDNIVLLCMDQKLRDWQIPGPPVYEDALTDNGDILVYFHAESLNAFKPPEEWTQVVRQTHKEKRQESQEMNSVACAIPSRLSFSPEAFRSIGKPEESRIASLGIHTPSAQEMLGHRVLQSLEEEKKEHQRCTDQFQRWLDSDPLDHISTLFFPSHTLVSTPLSATYTPAAKAQDATIP